MIEGTIIPQNDEYSVPMTNIIIKDISKKSAEQIYEELQPLVKQKKALMELLKKILDGHKFSNDEKELTPQEKEIVKRWKELLVEATELGRQKGNIPAGIERYVQILLEQKMDWRSLLHKYIVREIPSDVSFSMPHRKSITSGYFVPSVKRENIRIVVHVDISGSINQKEYDDAVAEIIGIGRSFDNISMTVIFADCGRIKEENVLEVSNGNIEIITEKKVKGGGGTSHQPIFEYIEENIPNCKLFISLTDGYSDIERLSQPNFNVIWVISKNGVKKEFQFGETIFLED